MLMLVAAVGGGIYAFRNIPVDALPDVSDVQVIVFTEWPGQPPQIVEDQVTYPITTMMLAVSNVRVVRGYSFFGYSFVYIIFKDGTDIYWARSRVLEYLSALQGRMPAGVTPRLGPDATPVGWVYEYALVDHTGTHDLAELRTIQDWYLRYQLQTVAGVAEVASLGGFVKQYQVDVDPNKLLAYNIPLDRVIGAIRRSNNDVGGRVVEYAEAEYVIEGIGYIQKVSDIENVPVGVDGKGTPIMVRDVANVHLGPDMRRGVAELDGHGEVVGGIIEMRYGKNALDVINGVKRKVEELKPGLPKGVEIVPIYDRSALIHRSLNTLRDKLVEESIIVALVCVIFLLHFRSALVIILTLPVAILVSFVVMYFQGIIANIMSLGGIAIAIGAMVDAAIIMVENAHKGLERWEESGQRESRLEVIANAAAEVGPSLFFSLLVITVGFLPIFALGGPEGRMFRPLAYTKTYAMLFSSLLAVTLTPVLMTLFIRGKVTPEERHPVSRALIALYHPLARFALRFRYLVIVVAIALIAATVPVFQTLGSEFMPPLNEGDLLYMPSLLPSASITESKAVAQQTDKLIMTVPEVKYALAKAGRAESPLDPAPIEMLETAVILKPESEWRPGMTIEKLTNELDRLIRFPGVTNAWTMPIKTRIDMLSTGIKTPVGIKLTGASLGELQRLGEEVEPIIRSLPGTRSVYAERASAGYYVDFVVNRAAAARYGLTVGDVEDVIQSAIGGENISTTIEGLERYPVNVRYGRDLRTTPEALKRVLIPTPTEAQVPIEQVAAIFPRRGPTSIKTEGARPQAWIYVDIDPEQDIGSYVERAQAAVARGVKLPPGYTIQWSGQYEYMLEAKARLKVLVPVTLGIIFVLLYLNTASIVETIMVLLAVPFSLVGAFWLLYILGYNLSVAVWVGIIALAGLDAETGVVMLLYLDIAYRQWRAEGRMASLADLEEAVLHGAVKRVRPKLMTISVILAGLIPILWSQGTGADVMKRIAAPMVGGVITSAMMELMVYPALYTIWKWRWEVSPQLSGGAAATSPTTKT